MSAQQKKAKGTKQSGSLRDELKPLVDQALATVIRGYMIAIDEPGGYRKGISIMEIGHQTIASANSLVERDIVNPKS